MLSTFNVNDLVTLNPTISVANIFSSYEPSLIDLDSMKLEVKLNSLSSRKYFTSSILSSIICGIIAMCLFTTSGMVNRICGSLSSCSIVVNLAATEIDSVGEFPPNKVECNNSV